MILWLIRHPPVAAPPGLCYGRLAVPLREPAAAVVDRMTERLPTLAALRTSPAARCRAVAERLGRQLGLAPVEDARWQELDFGAWEGRAWSSLPRAEIDRWAEDHWNLAPPGGETYRALFERVAEAVAALGDGGDVAVVSHAGPIRAALAVCLGWPPHRLPAIEVPYGAVLGLRRGAAGWSRC